MSGRHRGQVRPVGPNGPRGPRFEEEAKPYVPRPPMLMPAGACWCGEVHPDGLHWGPLDDAEAADA